MELFNVIFGIFGLVVLIWQLLKQHKEIDFDKCTSITFLNALNEHLPDTDKLTVFVSLLNNIDFTKIDEVQLKLFKEKIKGLKGNYPIFGKEDLGFIYQIGFNHAKNAEPSKKNEVVEVFCTVDSWNKI